jgi:hypothetical protein
MYYLMGDMDLELPPCLQVLWHAQRRGLHWFQPCQFFLCGLSIAFVLFLRMARTHGLQQALLKFLMKEMDWELPPCLRVLRHVHRRGPSWLQQCRSSRLGYSFDLVHFVRCVWQSHGNPNVMKSPFLVKQEGNDNDFSFEPHSIVCRKKTVASKRSKRVRCIGSSLRRE